MKNRNAMLIVTLLLAAVLLFTLFGGQNLFSARPKEVKYNEFLTLVQNGEFDYVYIEGYWINGYKAVAGSNSALNTYKAKIGTRESVLKDLQDANGDYIVNVSLDDPNANALWSQLLIIGVGVVALFVIFWLMSRMQGGGSAISNFGKSPAKVTSKSNVRFSDVAGCEEEKEELEEIVAFLKSPKKFTELGARIPRGALLVGPPGTGKTLFAKAVAGEANVPFFSISGSDFVEMYVGVGASRVRNLFDQAKKNSPCIVFIDEIDAVGRQRGAGLGGGNDEREQTLNELLVQMDGFAANDGVIVMAATNRADILDPALLRPGRFDRQIYVSPPDVRGREAIFKVHSRNKPLSDDINFKELARITSGFTGADIANVLNEAAILAARKNRKSIMQVDINEAINKVVVGTQKKSRVVTESDKRITAYHEAGHAILARVLSGNDPVQEVSIIPRGMAAGYTMTRPDSDDNHVSKLKLLDRIAMMLGGRAAEEVVIKDVCTGAESDLKHATSVAKSMVCEWGMSDVIGPMHLGGDQEVFLGRDYQSRASYSENLGAVIDAEIKKIMESSHEIAVKTLTEKRAILDNMARLLIERETIYAPEVDMLIEGKPLEEIEAMLAERERKEAANKKN